MVDAYYALLANLSNLVSPPVVQSEPHQDKSGCCPALPDYRLGPPGIWLLSDQDLAVFRTGGVLSLFQPDAASNDKSSPSERNTPSEGGLLLQRCSAIRKPSKDFSSVNSFESLSDNQSDCSIPSVLQVPPMVYARRNYRVLQSCFRGWRKLCQKVETESTST